MTRPSFFALLLRNTLGAFAVFIVVFLAVFAGGFWFSREQWQDETGTRIETLLATQLDQLVDHGGKLEGEAVNRALMNVLEPTVFVLVFHPDGTLIFWSWKGRSWYEEDTPEEAHRSIEAEVELLKSLPPEDHPVFQEKLYERLKDQGKLVALVRQGREVGAYYAGHHSFELLEENLQFVGKERRHALLALRPVAKFPSA